MRRVELSGDQPDHRRVLGAAVAAALFGLLTVGLVVIAGQERPLPEIARRAMVEALPAFRTTEPVSAVVYGFRAMDTFGETFLLLAAVVSVVVLSRTREERHGFVGEERAGEAEQAATDPAAPETPDERAAREAELAEAGEHTTGPDTPDAEPVGSPAPERSPAMTVVTRSAIRVVLPVLSIAGLYLVAQGYSPGGGFPAGAVVLGVILLVDAGFGYPRIARVVRPVWMESIELGGAMVIIVLLILGWLVAGSFAASWIPLAPEQTLRSGGLLQAFSVAELVEVASGLVITVFALMGMRHDWAHEREAPG